MAFKYRDYPGFDLVNRLMREAMDKHRLIEGVSAEIDKLRRGVIDALIVESKQFTDKQFWEVCNEIYWSHKLFAYQIGRLYVDKTKSPFQPAEQTIAVKCSECEKANLVTIASWNHREYEEHLSVCYSCTEAYYQRSEQCSKLKEMSYKDYLLTDHWTNLRLISQQRADWKCQLCYGGKKLHTHHRTYRRRGCERISDLTVLCESCHEKFHDITKGEESDD